MDLDDLVAGMLTDVKKGKHKKPRKKNLTKRKVFGAIAVPGKATVKNPWQDEAIVMLATTFICKTCGNEGTFPNAHMLIRRQRVIKGRLEVHEEALRECDFNTVYTSLPKRIEHLQLNVCYCHLCFGDLPMGFKQPEQLSLWENTNGTTPQEIHVPAIPMSQDE